VEDCCKAQHHLAARRGAAEFQEADMPLRDIRRKGKSKLRQPARSFITTCHVVAEPHSRASSSFSEEERRMLDVRGERFGVGVAVASSTLGGTAGAVTRYLVGSADPVTLAVLRFSIGFLCVLPVALTLSVRWPLRRDLPAVVTLGVAFFAIFFVLYNVAMGYTMAARASPALSILLLQTMLVGALLGVERLGARKAFGVLLAMAGVAAALGSGLTSAPLGAWRGELIMAGAVFCMALCNVWSRPFIQRSIALGFLATGMGVGAAVLLTVAGGSSQAPSIGPAGQAPPLRGRSASGIAAGHHRQ
jgi:drug/metabolite transporter (DMT)-like permease